MEIRWRETKNRLWERDGQKKKTKNRLWEKDMRRNKDELVGEGQTEKQRIDRERRTGRKTE